MPKTKLRLISIYCNIICVIFLIVVLYEFALFSHYYTGIVAIAALSIDTYFKYKYWRCGNCRKRIFHTRYDFSLFLPPETDIYCSHCGEKIPDFLEPYKDTETN